MALFEIEGIAIKTDKQGSTSVIHVGADQFGTDTFRRQLAGYLQHGTRNSAIILVRANMYDGCVALSDHPAPGDTNWKKSRLHG